jgi:AraC-like DNA-binding protein
VLITVSIRLDLPSDYIQRKPEAVLRLGELTVVRHRSGKASWDNRVFVRVPMVMAVMRGRKSIRWPGHRMNVATGEAVFASPGEYRMSEEEPTCEALLVFFDPEFVARVRQRHPDIEPSAHDRGDPAFVVQLTPFLKASIDSIGTFVAANPRPARRLVEHKLEETVLSLVDADSRVWPWLASSTSRHDRQLVRYVEAQIGRRRTLADLARGTGRSLSTFKRRFREMTGQSPATWLRERRLERARILLQTTDRSVTDVALEVGFSSVSHFVHAFRRRFRTTPQRVRKNQKRHVVSRSRKT